MKKPNNIRFILSAKKILSVNALYGAKLKYVGKNKPIATMYKNDSARKMEEYIKEQVKSLDIPKNHPWVNKSTLFKLNFTVIFRSGFLMRDLDNCCKNLIDGIWRAMGLNDSHIIEIQCEKTLCKEIKEEMILIEISEYTGEPIFNKLQEDKPSPSLILVTGDNIKIGPLLTESGFSWTADESEDYDSHLYLLSPGEADLAILLVRILNTAWEIKENDFGSCIVGILGTEEDWGHDDFKSIEFILEKLKKLGGESPKIVGSFIQDPKELLNYYKKLRKRKK